MVEWSFSRWVTWLLGFVAVLFVTRTLRAEEHPACEGPEECCAKQRIDVLPAPQTVRIGVVLMGIGSVNERAGTWDADFYLYESWAPIPGFTPQTDLMNETNRGSEQFDVVWLSEGRCVRSRRIRSTLHTKFDLRVFPFDHQDLTLRFADSYYTSDNVVYDIEPHNAGVEEQARDQLTAWQTAGILAYARTQQVWRWDPGTPTYDYATFSLRVQRHLTFHVTRFFLPLLVIVSVAFSVFWIDPSDLSSQAGIGVTCLLAAIAFQFTQASTLPEVSYLTLADRIYACCYTAIALALMESLYTNTLTHRGSRERALRIDVACRWLFPVGLVVAVGLSVLSSI
ncbi:MAG: hypothetical protein U0271_00225 [Polyangiaceae bacterium]